MTPNPRYETGPWLRRFARLFFDPHTLARVVDPTLADLEHEVSKAKDDAERRAARIRGYVAFWKLVVLSPFVFGDWPDRRQFARSLIHGSALVVMLVVIFGARSEWMMRMLSDFYPRLQPRLISIADVGVYAWLLAPIAVGFLAVIGRKSPFRVAPSAVIMICGATVTAAAAYGGTGFLAAFDEVGRKGSAGVSVVLSAMDAIVIPSILALGITTLMALAIAVSQWRARDLGPIDAAPGLPRASSVLVAVSMVLSVVVVNQWLLMNEDMIDVVLAATNPGVSGRSAMGLSEIAIPYMLLGFVIAVAMLVMSFAVWGRSRSRRPGRLLTWTTRLSIVATLVLCVWHGGMIVGEWREFRAGASAMLAR